MALKLSDCPPALYEAVMRQLAKEQSLVPQTTVTWCIARQATAPSGVKYWAFGTQSKNFKLVARLVERLQLQTGHSAHQTIIGNPPAVMVEIATKA